MPEPMPIDLWVMMGSAHTHLTVMRLGWRSAMPLGPQSLGIIHDADECRDESIVQLHGGHVVRVLRPLEEVLAWFQEGDHFKATVDEATSAP
jgi:hypothetical protein